MTEYKTGIPTVMYKDVMTLLYLKFSVYYRYLDKGPKKCDTALYESRGLHVDPNTYVEDSEEEQTEEVNHSSDEGQQEADEDLSHTDELESPRQQLFEYEGDVTTNRQKLMYQIWRATTSIKIGRNKSTT